MGWALALIIRPSSWQIYRCHFGMFYLVCVCPNLSPSLCLSCCRWCACWRKPMQFYVCLQPGDHVLSCWHVPQLGNAPKAKGQHGPVSKFDFSELCYSVGCGAHWLWQRCIFLLGTESLFPLLMQTWKMTKGGTVCHLYLLLACFCCSVLALLGSARLGFSHLPLQLRYLPHVLATLSCVLYADVFFCSAGRTTRTSMSKLNASGS